MLRGWWHEVDSEGTVEDGVSCAYPFWGEASTAPDDSAETNHRPLALCTSFCRPPLARVAVLSRLLVLVFFGKSQRQRRGIQFRSARRTTLDANSKSQDAHPTEPRCQVACIGQCQRRRCRQTCIRAYPPTSPCTHRLHGGGTRAYQHYSASVAPWVPPQQASVRSPPLPHQPRRRAQDRARPQPKRRRP